MDENIISEKLKKDICEKYKRDKSKIRIGSGTIEDLNIPIDKATYILQKWEDDGLISIRGYEGANMKNFMTPWIITVLDRKFFGLD